MVRFALRHRALLTDVVLVLLVLLFTVGHDRYDDVGTARTFWTPFFDLLLVLPLLVRRRWPLGVFAVMAAVALPQWLFDIRAGADLALLVALYTVGSRERRPQMIAMAALVAELGVLLATMRWAPPGQKITAFVLLTGTVTAAWVLGVYVRTRRAYTASVLERAETAERERDQQALLATASERGRISREMHDIVAHSLSVMIALSDGAAASVTLAPGDAEQAMRQASALGRQSLGEVRRLLGTLHEEPDADLAPAPGIAQLDDLAGQVRAAGLAVDLVVVGERADLPPAAQLTVYRMVQEALTNVLKHAPGAGHAVVTLRYAADGVDIEVENDGGDPRPTVAPSTPGHGLNGMRERAAVFHGTVDAAPRPGGGWRVASRLRLEGPMVER